MTSLIHVSLQKPTMFGQRPVSEPMYFAPLKRYTFDNSVVLPLPFSQPLVNGEAIVPLAANGPDWCWMSKEPTKVGLTRYFNVPETNGGVIEYRDLIDVDLSTLDPEDEPEAMWWAIANNGFLPVFSIDPGNPDALLVYMQTWQRDPVTGALLVQVRVDND